MSDVLDDKPIAFKPWLVRAIRAGQKTQTRRLPKVQPDLKLICNGDFPHQIRHDDGLCKPEHIGKWIWPTAEGEFFDFSPYRVGQVLWVREPYRLCAEFDAYAPRYSTPANRIWYEADEPHQPGFGKLRPGMFMVRWMARELLRVTDVRMQRLQDISEADALAEGIRWRNVIVDTAYEGGGHVEKTADRFFFDGGNEDGYDSAVDAYLDLWEVINGFGSADLNPYVFAYTFERIA